MTWIDRMVILHALAPAHVGGLERVVCGLTAGHSRLGHDVHAAVVLDRDVSDHPFPVELRTAGVEVHVLGVQRRRYDREWRWVRALCERLRPDVVHTHGYRCDVVAASAARSLGIPTITTVHGFTLGGARNRLYEILQRRAFRKFDAVVAVSRPQVEQLTLAGVRRTRIRLVPNAFSGSGQLLGRREARCELGFRTDQFGIGWVGRVSEEKGLDVLLEALPLLRDLPLDLAVLGDGTMRSDLQTRARSLGLSETVRWLGLVRDAARLFSGFDLFVLSSRTEGTPIALFEAMAAGVPIVATRVGGVPDVVSEREAYLVSPEDPTALAAAIRGALNRPDDTRRRAQAAQRRLAARFGPEPWLQSYEALYRELQGAAAP